MGCPYLGGGGNGKWQLAHQPTSAFDHNQMGRGGGPLLNRAFVVLNGVIVSASIFEEWGK